LVAGAARVAGGVGDLANLTTELRASASGCMVLFNATINGVTVATGNRTSTTYGTLTTEINLTGIQEPYNVALWIKRNATSCTAYNQGMGLQQKPTKLEATKASAKSFVQIAGNAIQAGLTYFSSTATLSKQLALMGSANQSALETAIDALTASGGTCIECGLTNAADELTSVRARSGANKVIILLISLTLGLLLFVYTVVSSDVGHIIQTLKSFSLLKFLIFLALSFANSYLLSLRWEFIVKAMWRGKKISTFTSFLMTKWA
jgi:hypothetical protein